MPAEWSNYGVTVPRVTALTTAWARESVTDIDDVLEAARLLWAPPIVYEHRLAAAKLLSHSAKHMLDTAGTWALVDEIAVKVAGRVLAQRDDEAVVLAQWAAHRNFWMRRSCLLAHLELMRGGDGTHFERFAAFAEPMLDEKEFFIQKAIGWVLRDTSRKLPALVNAFALQHARRLSTVTHREAVKKLTAAQKSAIAALRQ